MQVWETNSVRSLALKLSQSQALACNGRLTKGWVRLSLPEAGRDCLHEEQLPLRTKTPLGPLTRWQRQCFPLPSPLLSIYINCRRGTGNGSEGEEKQEGKVSPLQSRPDLWSGVPGGSFWASRWGGEEREKS